MIFLTTSPDNSGQTRCSRFHGEACPVSREALLTGARERLLDVHPREGDSGYEQFKALVPKYATIRRNAVKNGGDPTVLTEIVRLCEAAPDDAHIGAISVLVLEPLLDLHWPEIGTHFEAAMRESSALRRAYSGVSVDLPESVLDRLDALVQPSDDIG